MAAAKQGLGQKQWVGVGRIRRDNCSLAEYVERVRQSAVIEEIAWQPGPLAEAMFGEQFTLTDFVPGQIERMSLAQATGQSLCRYQFNKPAGSSKAAATDVGGSFESINIRELGQRAIDFPQQHRGTCCGTAKPGTLPVDNTDVVPLRCEMFRRQRTCDSGADNEHLATEISFNCRSDQSLWIVPHGRRTAA